MELKTIFEHDTATVTGQASSATISSSVTGKKFNKLFLNIRQQAASTVIPERRGRSKARPTIPCFRLEVLSELGCRGGTPKHCDLTEQNQTLGKRQQLELERTTQRNVYRGPLVTWAKFQAARMYSESPQN